MTDAAGNRRPTVNTFRTRARITSDTIRILELNAFVGRDVEIVVGEVFPEEDRWDRAARLVGGLKNYDFDALREQKEIDQRAADEVTWNRDEQHAHSRPGTPTRP